MSDGKNPPETGMGRGGYPEKIKGFLLHPAVVVVVLGLAIRLMIMPLLTHNYDVTYWALIIRNLQSGNGLYQVTGYYYTPVWGYVLAIVGKLCAVSGVEVTSIRFDDLLVYKDFWWNYYVEDLTNVSFNVMVKIPLVICDIVVGYLIYWLIRDRTEDTKKAVLGLALWMFCPIIVFLSAAHGMFDTISVLFTLLTVIFVYKGMYFRGGMAFSAAILTKFFPIYLVFVLFAYVFRKHRGDRLAQIRAIERAALGFVAMTLLIYAPVILQNTVLDSFLFLTSRLYDAASSGVNSSIVSTTVDFSKKLIFVIQPVILALVVYVSYRFLKSENEDTDGDFLKACMFSLALAFSMPMSPQYLVIILPFLIYYVAVADWRYFKAFVLVSTGAMLADLSMCNVPLLSSLAKYTGLIRIDTILNILHWMDAPFMGMPRMFYFILVSGLIQMAGIWLIVYKGASEVAKGGVNEG